MPPHVVALILTATLLLFLAGLVVSNVVSHGSQPIAPSGPFVRTAQ